MGGSAAAGSVRVPAAPEPPGAHSRHLARHLNPPVALGLLAERVALKNQSVVYFDFDFDLVLFQRVEVGLQTEAGFLGK